MAHRSQSSSVGDNPLDPNYLPPHYREEYRLAIDALIEDDSQVIILLWLLAKEVENMGDDGSQPLSLCRPDQSAL